MPPAIATHALRKVYPAPPTRRRPPGPSAAASAAPADLAQPEARPVPREVVALDGLDLEIERGEFFGLLGPNGAGKTTTIGILTTRILASSGSAQVAGADVTRDPVGVRSAIGVVPQQPNADHRLDVLQNLLFHAAYFGIGRQEASARAHALLGQLGLLDKTAAKPRELSGGQLQRLMIARALMHEPEVVFLDEPTVGLDPAARRALWEVLRTLHRQGRTIVMTTHYMEEADQLCDRLGIVDQGKLLALDTPSGLKQRAPDGALLELHLDRAAAELCTPVRSLAGIARAEAEGDVLRVYSANAGQVISPVIDVVERAGGSVNDIELIRPSLETLFIELTGRKLR